MRTVKWTRILAGAAVVVMAAAGPAQAQFGQPPRVSSWPAPQATADYNRGFEQGVKEGQQDARKNRAYQAYPNGNSRKQSDINFRQGFEAGYRSGFDQVRNERAYRDERRDDRRDDRRDGNYNGRRAPGYQEPAVARGYSDGYQRGLDDSRSRHNYDPVGERDYREADQGYYSGYGSKDAYKNNYRAGFRQGYEDGYRQANRR